MICNLFPPPTFFLYSPDVPALLYYAHIPANIIALLISLYAFWNNRHSLLNKLLLVVSVLFSFWTLSNLVLWTNINSDLMIFVWSWLGMILGTISISCIYLTYVFLNKKDVTNNVKAVFFVLLAPIILFAHTTYNLSGFNITTCDAFQYEWTPYKLYSSFLGVLAMIWIFILIIRRYRIEKTDFRKQIILMGVGIELFLFSFFTMEFLASYLTKIGLLPDSGLEIYGLFGMVIFMSFITVLIVRFKAFNVHLLGAQALVVALNILIGSQFFFIQNSTNRILNSITFVLSVIFGYFLIRGVKKEIQTREHIEKLAKELQKANARLKELDQQKTEFISLATHQIRGPLGSIKGYTSMLLEGDFGVFPEIAKDSLKTIMKSVTALAVLVNDYLDVSRIEQGRMTFDFSDFDLKDLVKTVVNEYRPNTEEKKLTLTLECDETKSYLINADMGKIKQVIGNLLDNSVKYTPTGSIHVSLVHEKKSDGADSGKLLITIKDTGVGIRPEVMPNLFAKFSRAPDASKTNIMGTGLGLFVAKKMIEAHKGRVWAESEGADKGAQMYIELMGK